MRSNRLTTIGHMSAGAMRFVLADEPTRTRADAAEAAHEALDLIAWARDLAGASTLSPDPTETGARMLSSSDGRMVRMRAYGGSDQEIQILIERDRDFSLSCSVAAQWARPSKASLVAALDLFEAAGRAVLEPMTGDEAMLDLRAHIVDKLQTTGIDVVHATAATPWRNGVLRASKDVDTFAGGHTWTDVEGAYVVCVRTFSGITLAIEPLQLTATSGMFDPMETLRLLARLKR